MIDTAGVYILILITLGRWEEPSGVATQEMASFEACKAAQVQLEPIVRLDTYCIAKDVVKEAAHD